MCRHARAFTFITCIYYDGHCERIMFVMFSNKQILHCERRKTTIHKQITHHHERKGHAGVTHHHNSKSRSHSLVNSPGKLIEHH